MAQSGRLVVNGPQGPLTDPAEMARRLAKPLDNALAGFLRNGLLPPA